MTNDTELQLKYGRRTFPKNVRAVFGARLIWPNDLLWDRQDLIAVDDEHKQALVTWLNGPNRGDGALSKALAALKEPYSLGLRHDSEDEAIIYEDDLGKIIGSAQGSHGYCYVAGWLKAHVDAQ